MDALLYFRSQADSATAVTADETGTVINIPGGTLHARMFAKVGVKEGAVGSSTGTVVFKVQGRYKSVGGTWYDVTPSQTVALTTTAAAAKQMLKFPVESEYDEYQLSADGTGTSWTIKYWGRLDLTEE